MPNFTTRMVGIVIITTLLVSSAPVARADGALDLRSVGSFLVDAQGRASGLNLAATLNEGTGAITGVTSLSLGQGLFDRIAVDNFVPLQKLYGVGTTSLALRGTNADILLHDDANAVIQLLAKEPTTFTFDVAPNVRAIVNDKANIVDLTTLDGTQLGSIVANGGAKLGLADNKIRADAVAGSLVSYIGKPAYLDNSAYLDTIMDSVSDRSLAASFVTEWAGARVLTSNVAWGSTAIAQTTAEGRGIVSTNLQTSNAIPTLLSYDLAYASLPARVAGDVSVFADGHLLQAAKTASEVKLLADQGIVSYHAIVEGGRSLVLVAAPQIAGQHHILLDAHASAPTEAQALAERATGRVSGLLSYEGNGKLLGDFVTGMLSPGNTDLRHYTSLVSKAEVFDLVTIAGNGAGILRSVDEARFLVQGAKADLTLVDDAYATLLIQAKSATPVEFDLAQGIRATSESPGVVKLVSNAGDVGWLIAVTGDATANPAQLDATQAGVVTAALAKGSRVVFRGASDAFTSESALALGIADGALGSQVLAGLDGAFLSTSVADHYSDVATKVISKTRNSVELQYSSKLATAKSLVLDAKSAALAAKSASDVRVLVDGARALQTTSAASALEPSTVAKYFAELSDDGSVRVIVNAASRSANILIETTRSEAAGDAFGAFKVFQDGTAVGDFVTLHVEQSAGALTDVTLLSQGKAVFSSVLAGGAPFNSAPVNGAASLVLDSKDAKLEVADSTQGAMKLLAKRDLDAAFRLAEGIDAEQVSTKIVSLGDAGSLLVTGAGSLDVQPNQIVARLSKGAEVIFKANSAIDNQLSSAQRSMIQNAISSGAIAGSVIAQTKVGALEASALGSLNPATALASPLGDIQMVARASYDRVDITISSVTNVGKTILVSLDKETLPQIAHGDAEILFDGVPTQAADSLADVLDATDDGGVAEYFVLAGDAGNQVLVSIPHFSVHSVTMQPRTQGAAGYYPYALVVLGLVVAAQSALLIRRRKA